MLQRRRHRRLFDIRHVGVPDRLVGAQLADRDAVLDNIRDHHHILAALRSALDIAVLARHLDLGGGDRRPVKLAELLAETQ
jgi:hypothetical protein